MTNQQSEIDQVFLEAVEHSLKERPAFLDGRCDGLEPIVREEVEKLLDADGEASDADLTAAGPRLDVAKFLASTHDGGNVEEEGSVIGPYRLLQKLGEGGMGSVYMAEQKQPVRRRVALKLIKPGMDSKQVVARFEAERQALAMMEHPNIAKVLDVGTTDRGRPYFVMELVMGIPITRFCEEKRLIVSERLKLFMSVCHAVQHAHQKSVIHRDLKPSNILVAEYDNTAVPKIIDFGLAKALHQQLTEKTLFTNFGQVVGTFEYMSPEQAKMNQLDIDTRTDIYSLGVVLYELMTGCTPLDTKTLRAAAFDEMLRMIRDVDPPRPSTRLTNSATSSTAASSCQSEPKKLSLMLRGDLDAIIMKSLDKERSNRYETSTAFADDVQRYLSHEPVLAAPASSLYYLKRFVRRNRAVVMTVCLVFLILVATTALTTTFWRKSVVSKQNETQAKVEALAAAERESNQKQKAEGLNTVLSHSLYVSDMNVAFHAWNSGNETRTQQLIAKQIPQNGEADHRGIEWHYVAQKCAKNRGNAIATTDLGCGWCLSPDKGSLATVKDGNLVQINLSTRDERVLIEKGAVDSQTWRGSLAYTAEGRGLAVESLDKVHVINVATGTENFAVSGKGNPNRRFQRIAFSPDGNWGANIVVDESLKDDSNDGALLQLWSTDGGHIVWKKPLHMMEHHTKVIAFSPDSSRLCVCGPRTLAIWDVEKATGEIVPAPVYVRSAAFLTDSVLVLTSTFEHVAFDIADQSVNEEMTSNLFKDVIGVGAIDVDREEQLICLGTGKKNSVEVWGLGDGFKARKTRADSVHEVKFGDGDIVYSSSGRVVEAWNHSHLEFLPWPESTIGWFNSVLTRGSKIYLPCVGSRVLIWDVEDGSHELLDFGFPSSEEFPHAMALSPDGSTLASTEGGGNERGRDVILWDLTQNKLLTRISQPDVDRLAFSPDGVQLAITSTRGVSIWDTQDFAQVWDSGDGVEKGGVIFSKNGHYLYEGGGGEVGGRHDHHVTVWDLRGEAPRKLKRFPHNGYVDVFAVSPDGRWIAVGDMTGRIAAYDTLNPNAHPKNLLGHSTQVTTLAFSPDGTRLVSGSYAGMVKFWQAGGDWKELGGMEEPWLVSSVRFVESPTRGTGFLVGRPTGGPPVVDFYWKNEIRMSEWSWLSSPH